MKLFICMYLQVQNPIDCFMYILKYMCVLCTIYAYVISTYNAGLPIPIETIDMHACSIFMHWLRQIYYAWDISKHILLCVFTWLIHNKLPFLYFFQPLYAAFLQCCLPIASLPFRHAISNASFLNLPFLSILSMLSFLFTVSLPFRIFPPCIHPVFLHFLLQILH